MPLNETRHYGCECLHLVGLPAKKVDIKYDEQLTDGVFMVFKDRDRKAFDGIEFFEGGTNLKIVYGKSLDDDVNIVVGDNVQNVGNGNVAGGDIRISVNNLQIGASKKFNFRGTAVSQSANVGGSVDGIRALEIDIRVPVGFPISIDGGFAAKYEVDTAGGNLELDLYGSATLKAAAVGLLKVDLSDSSHVEVDLVEGDIKADVSKSAGLLVRRIMSGGEVEIDASMSGSVTISDGEIDYLEVDASMSGTVNIGSTVVDAEIDASMSGTVTVREITGALEIDKGTGATVVVHEGPHSASGRRAAP